MMELLVFEKKTKLKSSSMAPEKDPGISLSLARDDFLSTKAILEKNKMQKESVQCTEIKLADRLNR